MAAAVLVGSLASAEPSQAQGGPVPDQPTGLSAEASHDRVGLTWDDPGDGSITHYEVLRRDRGVHGVGEFVTVEADTGSAAAGYSDHSAQPQKRYVYRVVAVNAHGASKWSSFARANTPAAPPQPDPAPDPAPAPAPEPDPAVCAAAGPCTRLDESDGVAHVEALELTGVTHESLTLEWTAPAGDAPLGYVIVRTEDGAAAAMSSVIVANTESQNTSHTDSGLEPDTLYEYRVLALRHTGVSAYKDAASASATTEPAPVFTPGHPDVPEAEWRETLTTLREVSPAPLVALPAKSTAPDPDYRDCTPLAMSYVGFDDPRRPLTANVMIEWTIPECEPLGTLVGYEIGRRDRSAVADQGRCPWTNGREDICETLLIEDGVNFYDAVEQGLAWTVIAEDLPPGQTSYVDDTVDVGGSYRYVVSPIFHRHVETFGVRDEGSYEWKCDYHGGRYKTCGLVWIHTSHTSDRVPHPAGWFPTNLGYNINVDAKNDSIALAWIAPVNSPKPDSYTIEYRPAKTIDEWHRWFGGDEYRYVPDPADVAVDREYLVRPFMRQQAIRELEPLCPQSGDICFPDSFLDSDGSDIWHTGVDSIGATSYTLTPNNWTVDPDGQGLAFRVKAVYSGTRETVSNRFSTMGGVNSNRGLANNYGESIFLARNFQMTCNDEGHIELEWYSPYLSPFRSNSPDYGRTFQVSLLDFASYTSTVLGTTDYLGFIDENPPAINSNTVGYAYYVRVSYPASASLSGDFGPRSTLLDIEETCGTSSS